MDLPLPRQPFFRAISGSEFDSYPERDLSGMTSREVAKLSVKMNNGEILVIPPSRAPRRLRGDLPWLNQLRFFDKFFPTGERPIAIVAFDQEGRILARRKPQRGSFAWIG